MSAKLSPGPGNPTMSGFVCRSCRTLFEQAQHRQSLQFSVSRASSTFAEPLVRRLKTDKIQRSFRVPPKFKEVISIDKILETPTWSVRTLLPSAPPDPNQISDAQFDHLLRLSALQLPENNPEEARQKMKQTLVNQLHFVQDIQKVNTEDVEPLVVVRNETEEGINDITIGLEELKEALGKEDVQGRMKRPRRQRDVSEEKKLENWDCLATAGEVVERGDERYFVVYSGKKKLEEGDDILNSMKIKKRSTVYLRQTELKKRRRRAEQWKSRRRIRSLVLTKA